MLINACRCLSLPNLESFHTQVHGTVGLEPEGF